MVENAAASLLGKIAERLVDPIVREFCYVFQYRNNIDNLKDELDGLQASKEGVKIQVDAAEYNLEIVDPAMQSWAKRVEGIETKASKIIEKTSNVDKKCLNVWCPNVMRRYLLSRNALKVTRSIGKLKVEGKSYTKSTYSAPPPGIMTADALVPKLPTKIDATPHIISCKDLGSRKSILKQVMDALEDDGIRMIGISGIGGVGKTTFVNEVCEKARAQGLFEEYAMMSVSQKQDLHKIQDELAEMLGLKFTDQKSILARAQRLRTRLTNGRKILVILDDIWKEIPLTKVGIPEVGDRGGWKVLFTSRYKSLFSDMGTQLNVSIECLTRRESWDLFEKNIGDYKHLAAREIVNRCRGIPIAIVILAKALRKEAAPTWDYVLDQLKQCGVDEDPTYKSVELSYNLLKDKKAKNLLVLCCLFKEDANIRLETLVRLNGCSDVEERRSNVSNLVGKLKSLNFLLEGNLPETVKVHDIVRSVCLSAEGLDRWPERAIQSRESTYKEVWDALCDDQIHTIGIHGMAGVGKTTLMHEINEKVQAHKLFDEVLFICVPQLQSEYMRKVPELIGLVNKRDHDITRIAELVHERLCNGSSSRILIILDNVWERFDLQVIGLLNRGVLRGRKLLIITRTEKVCQEMGIQKIVEVGLLSDEEAWNIFKEHAGLCADDDPEFYMIGSEIVRHCGHLPLTIVSYAQTLKGKELTLWTAVLKDLRDYNINIIRDGVIDREAELLLLLCCIMEANTKIPIEKLVVCAKSVELFGDSLELDQVRNKVENLLDLLRRLFSLFVDDNMDDGTVTVHHLLRDMCLSLPPI